MYFQFRAHHPKARFWFYVFLLVASVANIVAAGLWFPLWRDAEALTRFAGLLVVPWLLLLLLPSVLSAIVLHRALFRLHRFHISDEGLTMSSVSQKAVRIPWQQLRQVQLLDFEDNHYCLLRFADEQLDRVLDRNTGEFDRFFQELSRHVDPGIIRIH